MNYKTRILALGFALVGAATSAQASLAVSASDDAGTLANTILGDDVTLVGTPTYSGAANASGSFSGGDSVGLGLDEGLLLTSGTVANAVGPNNSEGATVQNGAPGDSDLDGLLPSGGQTTQDASVLEFDFTSDTGDLFFNYVFASEEYNEFVDSDFNDVFGFFLDGDNIALVPGSSTPVAINNVNCGDPFDPPSGGPNCSAFNNNPVDGDSSSQQLQYDGLTDVFTAEAKDLDAGTHTIKLAIADTSDNRLDSGVFIQGASFSGNPTPPPSGGGGGTEVPEPGSLLLFAAGLLGLGLLGRRRTTRG